jgi:hypothetical protein
MTKKRPKSLWSRPPPTRISFASKSGSYTTGLFVPQTLFTLPDPQHQPLVCAALLWPLFTLKVFFDPAGNVKNTWQLS